MVVMVEAIFSVVGDVDVGPSIIVVITTATPKPQRSLATPALSVTLVNVPSWLL